MHFFDIGVINGVRHRSWTFVPSAETNDSLKFMDFR